MSSFKIKSKSKISQARTGILCTAHGKIQTPFFMPIATLGVVKTLSSEDLKILGAQIILANTYHLLLRPGMNLMKKIGSLHKFMNWSGPILTDSGGFQVYSLSKIRQVSKTGVTFRSHINGKEFALTPARVLKIQQTIGSDIVMLLDECVGYPATREQIEVSVKRTTLWAEKSVESRKQKSKKTSCYYKLREATPSSTEGEPSKLHFAIIQGGIYKDLRLQSARELVKLNYDGYAIGGLSVGEPWSQAVKVLEWVIPELPRDNPRYLMGVGYPKQITEAVQRGVDMFDCVIPTREARHGKLYAWKNPLKKLSIINYQLSDYVTLNIQNAKFSHDFSPISPNSKIPELRGYSRAYLHHLFKINELLAQRLATLNNVEFYLDLMSKIREAIKNNKI